MFTNLTAIMTPEDIRQAAKIERHKLVEENRKKRIFNPKQRIIGVDVHALAQQIQEKKDIKRKEEMERRYFELQLQHSADEANYKEFLDRMTKRRQLEEINSYRNIFQKKELRRDYDLENTKNQLEVPFYLRDGDPRWGVTVFEGEDKFMASRVAFQKQQQRQWLIQQMIERDIENDEMKKAEQALDQHVKNKDNFVMSLVQMEDCCRKKMEKSIAEFNKALATKKAAEKFAEFSQTMINNEIDMYNAMSSDLLMENRDLARSCLGPNRYNITMFKGMSEEEIANIKSIQRQQIAEAKAKKEKEKLEEQYWERYMSHLNKTISLKDQEMAKETQAFYKNLKFENQLLGQEQKFQKEYIDKVVFSNEVTPDFFNQFNKSTR